MNMSIIKLAAGYCHDIVFENDYRSWILSAFLVGDVGGNHNFLIWAKDKSTNQYGGNLSSLRKIKGYILCYLTMDYEEYIQNPEQYSVKLQISDFIFILEEWHRLSLKKSPYIIITREEDEFKIFASDTNPEPVIS